MQTGATMQYVPRIIVPDGLELVKDGRIFSYVYGDKYLQAMGFFSLDEALEVVHYIEAVELLRQTGQFQQFRPHL